MKSILTITTIFFFSLSGKSQITKDNWMTGGNMSVSSSKSKNLKMTTLLLTPTAGYFFKDRLAGGFRVGLNQQTLHYVGAPVKTRNSSFLASAFFRYYILPTEKK